MRPKLSILICTLTDRLSFLHNLLNELYHQNPSCLIKCEILTNSDYYLSSIGSKRNSLLQQARGEYVVYLDDDDNISTNYLEQIFVGIEQGVDHIGIAMMYMPDNGPHQLVLCSKDHKWEQKNGIFYRSAQHVCPVRAEIAKQATFPEISFGEDKAYADQITPMIKTEYLITEPIYYYKYRSNK